MTMSSEADRRLNIRTIFSEAGHMLTIMSKLIIIILLTISTISREVGHILTIMLKLPIEYY